MIKGLPRHCFQSHETWQKEANLIFQSNWFAACTLEDFSKTVPSPADSSQTESSQTDSNDQFLTIQLGEYSVIVVRDQQGQVSAWHNVCRHRGTRLVDQTSGSLKNNCITCPYHGWSYNCDGELIGAPNMSDVDGFNRSEFSLLPVHCATWAGMVFIHFGEGEHCFQTEMEPLITRLKNWQLDQLRPVKSLKYDVAANWKLIFQNYSECYHCPTVHPDLNQQTPYKSATNDLEGGPILGGPMQLADGYETVSKDGKLVAPIFPNLTDQQSRGIFYYTVFPNMFVSAHPDYVMIHRLKPISIDQTTVDCHFLSSDEATEDSLIRAWQMWDNVNQQDWQVCELTQSGTRSPSYQPGPYSNLEPMLIAFDRHYRNVMNMEKIENA